MSVQLKSSDGSMLAHMIDADSNFKIVSVKNEEIIEVRMKDVRLYPDVYFLSLYIGSITSTECYDFVDNCLSFEIIDGGLFNL